MNKFLSISLFLVAALIASINAANTDQADLIQDALASGADAIKSNVDNFVSVRSEKPRGVISSTIRGAGRLLRNVTLELGQFADTVGRGAVRLGLHTGGATVGALKNTSKRLLRVPNDPNVQKQSDNAQSASNTDAAKSADELSTDSVDPPSEAEASKPDELTNTEIDSNTNSTST